MEQSQAAPGPAVAPAPNSLDARVAGLSATKREMLKRHLLHRAGGTIASWRSRRDRSGPTRLSFSQELVWLLDQLAPGSTAYNMPKAFRLTGPLNVGALAEAIDCVVSRHEILRSNFVSVDAMPPHQVVRQHAVAPLLVVDLRSEPAEDRAAELQRRLVVETARSFDLAQDPVLRTYVFQLANAEFAVLFVTHHIAFDGGSWPVFFTELAAAYSAAQSGRPAALPALPAQYSDYAAWQREQVETGAQDEDLTYWREQLAGVSDGLPLPTDRPRPPVRSFQGARVSAEVGAPVAHALRAIGQQEGATLFMTLLAAFQALLQRYTGQPEILVGTPIANRLEPEWEPLIGFFANTLALRTDMTADPTFLEILERVRRVAIDAYAHQALPFEKVVTELNPVRDASRAPIVQVLFAFEGEQAHVPEFPGVSAVPIDIDREVAKFDLSLVVRETPQGLRLVMEYALDLFEARTIERLLAQFETLLEGIAAAPATRLSMLPIMPAAERQRVLVEWNATEAAYPTEQGIHELVAAQAARTPDAVAVVYDGEELTYRELEARANSVARRLQQLGVKRGALVGICVERSLDMIVGLLGILKTGGAYLPLDPEYPVGRLAFMLDDADVEVLVTQKRLFSNLPECRAQLLCIDSADLVEEAPAPVRRGGWGDDLAYVIYTSGSTGQPKGVRISHRAVVNFLWSMRCEPGLAADDVLVAVTTLAFDIAGLELFLPLLVGARLVIASRADAADGVRLASLLDTTCATVMQATPATWRLLLQAGWTGGPRFKVLCGGEAFPRELANDLAARAAQVWNLYGPTETTIWSTCARVLPGVGPVPIGRPIANTQVYVLDPSRQLVPLGVPGELYIGGDGVAAGYLHRPELTAERFVLNPFGAKASFLYRTGDSVRYLPDGTLEYLGRLDHQVKVRGFRIELGEIETALERHPGVNQAVVVAREDEVGHKKLVAYWVAQEPQAPGTLTLRQALAEQLPGYMVPSAFVELPVLPLTPNGKVDRQALPAFTGSRPDTATEYVAPVTPEECALAQIWAEALGVERIGIHDDFFQLAGDSLLAALVTARVRTAFGVEIPLHTLFEAPTVAQMALLVAERLLDNADPSELQLLLAELEAIEQE